MQRGHHEEQAQPPAIEPRWPTLLAILVAAVLYAALPDVLSVGPRWLLLLIVAAFAVPGLITHHRNQHQLNAFLGYFAEAIVTVFLLWSVVALVRSLPGRKIPPADLLRSAAALWLCNVLLFALWYWRLDAGGPYARHKRGKHTEGAFLFPRMTSDGSRGAGGQPWAPRFIDYLFLAFNTGTALSPTDTPVISQWAKLLVMLQALISLTLVAVLVGRAVNLL
jgi:hypothetical protein